MSVGHSDFRLVQRLPCLQIVLLCGNFLLPESLFTLERGLSQGQTLLCCLQLAALLRRSRAGNDCENLSLLDCLTQTGLNALDHSCNAWDNVRRPVFVQANFPRQ